MGLSLGKKKESQTTNIKPCSLIPSRLPQPPMQSNPFPPSKTIVTTSESRIYAIPPSYHSYTIWRNNYYNNRIQQHDLSNFGRRIEQNANDFLKTSEQKLREIQEQRARLEASLLIEKESKRTQPIESCMDLSERYSQFKLIDRKYFYPKPERPVLTDEMLLAIKDASRPEPSDQTLVSIDGVQIMRKDMRTLTNLNWLNDEIINAYFYLIVQRGQEPERKKVYAFNTFFYPKLRDMGYNSVKRWTRKVDIFSYDFLIVPVHLGNHWCLAFIDFSNRRICYFDSLGGSAKVCCDTLLDYLRCESNDKKKINLDDENWQLIDCYAEMKIPHQRNGSDCGVFACQYAEYVTRQAKLSFTQENMPYFRKKMIYELLTKRILE